MDSHKIDILFVSYDDWANAGALLAASCRSIGLSSVCLVRRSHSFQYSLPTVQWNETKDLQTFANKSKSIVFMHSQLPRGIHWEEQKIAVFHGGSRYRRSKQKLNALFNKVVDCTFIQTADLWSEEAKNPIWLIPPVDTELLQPCFLERDRPLVFAHHPSHLNKGTAIIRRVLYGNGLSSCIDTSIIPWSAHLNRLRACDVYVERMALNREGNKTGVWGLSALEAAALGKVVVTNDLWAAEYDKQFGRCPFIVANSEKALRKVVLELNVLPYEDFLALQKETHTWVATTHTFKLVGERIKEVLL